MTGVRIAHRYVLGEPLGAGGEARVFRAIDETNGGNVAVRLARGDVRAVVFTPPGAWNDGWVRALDAGTDENHGAYLVFELLEGPPLSDFVRDGLLTAEYWRGFVDASLDAVAALHAAGEVHGDLNADNFLGTAAGWKLLELPFARFEPLKGRSTVFGSIYTLPPEQIDGAPATPLSDLYALGCLYYYAGCGQWPHTGRNVQEVAVHCLIHPATPLHEVAPHLPAAWCAWTMQLLERKPTARPDSAETARLLLADAVA
jgi:serine/threonine-protein kinase